MSQRKVALWDGDSPSRIRKSKMQLQQKPKRRRNDYDQEDKRKKDRDSSSSSSSSSSSRSSSSQSSDGDQKERQEKRRKQQQKHETQKQQQRKSIFLQQEKLKELQQKEQEKRKIMIIKSQKVIEKQEDVIVDLQNELQIQKQNVHQLNRQKEQLKAKTEKIQTIEQEKNMVKSNFEAHKQRIQNVKKTFMKRQATLVDIKADNFNKALNKDRSRIREVGNTIRYLIAQLFFAISNQYLLSKYVYKISNSSGQKSEVYFSKNAFLYNSYLFSILIFIPFFVSHFTNTTITGIDSLLIHNYDSSNSQYVSITLIVFLLFQIIFGIYKYNDIMKKEVGQEEKKSKRLLNFKIVFGNWNWKIRDRGQMKKNQFALTKRVISYFSARDLHYEKYFDSNAGTFQKIFFRCLGIIFIISSICPIIIIHQKEIFLNKIEIKFICEIINGIVVAIISKIVSLLVIPLNKLEGLANQESRMKALYMKKFFAEIVPIFASILMSYSLTIDDDSFIFNLGELTNDVSFNSNIFVCREHQTAYQIVGLLIGYFIVNFIYQYLPAIANSIIKKSSSNKYDKEIQFDVIEASIPLLVMNTIFLCLTPFTFFAIFLFIIILLLNFLNEWMIQHQIRLPQYSGLTYIQIKGYICYFYNLTLLMCFCYYSFFFTRSYVPVYHVDNQQKYCNPFMGENMSIMSRIRDELYTTKVIGVVYDIITWLPLVYGFFIIYLVAYLVSMNQKKLWEKEFEKKVKELGGIKMYYEQRIERLEKRIDDANKYLETTETEDQDDYNFNDKKQKKRNDKNKTSIKLKDQEDDRRVTNSSIRLPFEENGGRVGSNSRIPKIGSLSSMNMPQSTKYINQQYLTTEVKEHDLSSKEDFSEELKSRKNMKSFQKNFF